MKLPAQNARNAKVKAALRTAFVGVGYLMVSDFVLRSFLRTWSTALQADLPYVLTLSTTRPYVYRLLSPLLVRSVMVLLRSPFPPMEAMTTSSLAFRVSTGLMLGALFGTALVWRALVCSVFPERRALADVVPALGLLALPATFVVGGFLYDFPELFFVSACYLALVRRNWTAWYLLLPLTVVNKEASVLVIAWWLALRADLPKRTWWVHAALSAVIGGAVVAALWWAMRERPGYVAQPNFLYNLHYWASMKWLLASRDFFGVGVRFPLAFHVVNLAILGCIWVLGKRRVPREITRAFAWSVSVVTPLFLLFGFENEIRVFAIAVPPLVVLGAGAVEFASHGKPWLG
jgi:hypothetical protein